MSFFYIKPQPESEIDTRLSVVLCPSSTSNHNTAYLDIILIRWCYVLLLHQTTTFFLPLPPPVLWCYVLLLHQTTTSLAVLICSQSGVMSFFYIKPQQLKCFHRILPGGVMSFFYIKPQPPSVNETRLRCGVMSFFYIKPQQLCACGLSITVVLCPSSTSNHNSGYGKSWRTRVVLCPSSTSNHNFAVMRI